MTHEADEPAQGVRHVILLEDDAAQRDLLLELFADEGIPVEVCATLADIRAALGRHPRSIVVADWWAAGDHQDLGEQQRAELDALSRLAPLILTTGREWARQLAPGELGDVVLIPKPYDLDDLIERVRRFSTG